MTNPTDSRRVCAYISLPVMQTEITNDRRPAAVCINTRRSIASNHREFSMREEHVLMLVRARIFREPTREKGCQVEGRSDYKGVAVLSRVKEN